MSYLEQISKAKLVVGESFIIPGANLLVERLQEEELKSKGGLYLDTHTEVGTLGGDRLLRVKVVAIGEGFIDKSGNEVPNDSELGDILFIAKHSVKWLTAFPIEGYQPGTLGLMSEEATQIRFRGEDSYKKFKQATHDEGATEAAEEPGKDGGTT